MSITVRISKDNDFEAIKTIYSQGIRTKIATFQTSVPSFEEWNASHIKECRLVAVNEEDEILGFTALSPVSSRPVYKGVAEVSIYIQEQNRGKQIGTLLLQEVIKESEEHGIWTLQSGIFEINDASISLHKKNGFRIIGVRERVAKDCDGIWRNVVLMERRSKLVGI